MSVGYNVYLGPYIEYDEVVSWEDKSICKSPGACGLGDCRFCPTCGLESPATERTWSGTPSRDDIYEAHDEALSVADDDCSESSTRRLIPNVRRYGEPSRDMLVDARREYAAVSGMDIAAEVAWFSSAFESEIAAIRALCDGVRIEWGLIVWQS